MYTRYDGVGTKRRIVDVLFVQVRLMGGHEGNVFINNQPVCDDFWDEADASVVCKMLGYSGGVPKTGSYFGMVSTNYAMDDVLCTGMENSLLDCPHTTTHNCETNEGAGVICNKGRFLHYQSLIY